MKNRFMGALLVVYAVSTLLFTVVLPGQESMQVLSQSAEESSDETGGDSSEQNSSSQGFTMSAADFAALCIGSVYPGAVAGLADSRDNEEQGANDGTGSPVGSGGSSSEQVTAVKEEEKPDPVVFGDEPVVLVVHTHATETYLPATSGNYHSKKQENSVRDVGEVLAKSLEEEGIAVVHDKTLHDSPSYNSSYSRSYETIEKLLEEYPTIECVIDLHRDATASDSAAATVSTSGKSCAKYMYVVSNAVSTYGSNLKFVKALNSTASKSFDGFTGNVLERGYAYNQNLSDKYLLLEFGNNRNDIEEVRNTARIYGKILAQTLKAGY